MYIVLHNMLLVTWPAMPPAWILWLGDGELRKRLLALWVSK
jgi:hypothetical protein